MPLARTEVLKENIASMIRVTRTSQLGTTFSIEEPHCVASQKTIFLNLPNPTDCTRPGTFSTGRKN
jgi:hypothetical protein